MSGLVNFEVHLLLSRVGQIELRAKILKIPVKNARWSVSPDGPVQALAALVFAKWRPGAALATCLLFGFLDALATRMQGVELPLIGAVPVQAIQALPYILTVVLLAGFIGKAIPPRASGIPYVKER